jgi:hypothetical protein
MNLDVLYPGQERTTHKPTRDDLPLAAFEVIHVAGAPHVYITRGAAEHGRDFALLSPKADAWLVDVLTSVAYYQSFYGLEIGQTYKFARGWLPGSMLNRLLVSSQELAPGVARLLPITEDEEKHAKRHGAPALEALLAGVDALAVDRASVA